MKKIELIFDGIEAFKADLKKFNTQFYFVGGCVRDLFLDKISKDIDIIVPHIEFNDLCEILGKYGDYELVGQSFPVVKFMPKGFDSKEPIDVAVPRIERSVGEGHKDFELIFNPNVTLEEDLKRRDFTINALAMDYDGNIIDLFNGLNDLNKRKIRMITPQSFTDDPLRMLRAIQFAVRFDFTIESSTFLSMVDNKELLSTISPERIREELEKGLRVPKNVGRLLNSLDLIDFGVIFGVPFEPYGFQMHLFVERELSYVEFVYAYFANINFDIDIISKVFYLTADEKTYLKLLLEFDRIEKERAVTTYELYLAGRKSPMLIDNDFLKFVLQRTARPQLNYILESFRTGAFPRHPKFLAVNGEYFMGKGLKGQEIGEAQVFLLKKIFDGLIKNSIEDIESSMAELMQILGK